MDFMPPENQLSPHHAPMGLKLWLAVFGLVLVVALGYLVWAQNNAPDTTDNSALTTKTTASPTASWKTYTNSTYGFSFKYPTSWKVQEADNEALTAQNLTFDVDYMLIGGTDAYGRVRINKKETGVDKLISDRYSASTNIKRENVTFAGNTATKITTGYNTEYFIIKGDYIFSITGPSPTPPAPYNADDLALSHTEQLLVDSFKFTK